MNNDSKPKLIIVTGAAGFISSAVVRQISAHPPNRVANVDCLTRAGNLEALGHREDDPRYAFEHVDIRNRETGKGLFDEHVPDAVLHLAAESHVDRSIDYDLVEEAVGETSADYRDRPTRFVADRPDHDQRYATDPSRIEAERGWQPHHSFEAGLRDPVRWYIDLQWWWEHVRSGAQRGERLGRAPEVRR